uniref:Uncharacterized protein n=1 Tax=Malus domestica TaxID=3750 RepID=E4Z8M6_MALDO|nr:hypothetical protein [Malus domestica]
MVRYSMMVRERTRELESSISPWIFLSLGPPGDGSHVDEFEEGRQIPNCTEIPKFFWESQHSGLPKYRFGFGFQNLMPKNVYSEFGIPFLVRNPKSNQLNILLII